MERTLTIIKPDSMEAKNAGNILAHLEGEGFQVQALKRMHLSKAQAQKFYEVHRERPFYDSLVAYMTSGPIIAAALAQGSNILLLDEPTTFLDPKHESDIYKILSNINKELNITIVSVTHDINNAVLNSRRIVILKSGSILYSGLPEKIMNNTILGHAYDKLFLFDDHPVSGQKIIVPEAIS